MSYTDETEAHNARVQGLIGLYNARRVDELMEHYCDDVVCFLPTIVVPGGEDQQWSHGKEEYRRQLDLFYEIFGKLSVVGVFASAEGSSVMVTDEHGNSGTFSFEVTAERKIRRVFFHHQPGKPAAAA